MFCISLRLCASNERSEPRKAGQAGREEKKKTHLNDLGVLSEASGKCFFSFSHFLRLLLAAA